MRRPSFLAEKEIKYPSSKRHVKGMLIIVLLWNNNITYGLNFGDIIVFRCVEYHALLENGVTTTTAWLLGGEIPNVILLVEPAGAWSTDSCACAGHGFLVMT